MGIVLEQCMCSEWIENWGMDLVKWVGCIYFNSSTCDLTLRCHNCALTYGLFVEITSTALVHFSVEITSTALVHFSVSASNMVQSTESQSQLLCG